MNVKSAKLTAMLLLKARQEIGLSDLQVRIATEEEARKAERIGRRMTRQFVLVQHTANQLPN